MIDENYFTYEILKDALVAVGDEMFAAMKRTSMSPIVYEILDFAVGVTDARGNLVAQGNGVVLFMATLDSAVRAVLDKHGPDGIHEGDIFITNDPYGGGGTHVSDVTLVLPVFVEGTLIAFVANKAHWTEVGGMAPGGNLTDSTEVYQEGLMFPTVKLFDRGTINQPLVDMIEANVRIPDMTLGDMWASVAANRVGERRIIELVTRYGLDTVTGAMSRILDYGERMVRTELERMPKGEFFAEAMLDGDGLGNGPFHAQVTVTISGDRFLIDFTGTDPQAPGSINTTRSGMNSFARAAYVACTAPHIPVNGGMFRPLEVICPDGTLFTAIRPAPTSVYWESGNFVIDLVWKAMAPHVPERLPAGGYLTVGSTNIWGTHPDTGEFYLLVEPLAGGWGAGHDRDGDNGQFCQANGETYNIPIEVAETRYGVRVERYTFNTEDGGAGRFRGGKGLVVEYRCLSQAWLTSILGRHDYPPWGMAGGSDGSPNRIMILRNDGTVEEHGKTARMPIAEGEVIRMVTGNGGGYGDPRARPRAAIAADLRDELVSPAYAESIYGYSAEAE